MAASGRGDAAARWPPAGGSPGPGADCGPAWAVCCTYWPGSGFR